jgi:uncharacterized protein YgiM (DUF1202 family)
MMKQSAVVGLYAARGAVALVALVIVIMMVVGWWGDFRAATGGEEGAGEETSTVEPTVTPDPDASAQEEPADGGPVATGKTVVVLVEGLNFRTGPSRDTSLITGLARGTQLEHLGTAGGWHHVKDADGRIGYVSASEQYSELK